MRQAHVRYSELASHHPGILYKQVMQSTDDAARYYDVMVWARQQDSEAFDIAPEYQETRTTRPIKIPTGPRPGTIYYGEVWEHGSTTSQEVQQLLTF